MKIVVALSDGSVARDAVYALRKWGFEASAVSPEHALAAAWPTIAIVDFNGDTDEINLLTRLCKAPGIAFVIGCCLENADEDPIVRPFGLELGAADIMKKPRVPDDFREIVARVRALVRRMPNVNAAQPQVEANVQTGELELHIRRREITYRGTPLVLTKQRYDLLAFGMQWKGNLIPYSVLLRALPNSCANTDRTLVALKIAVSRLHRKLRDAGCSRCFRTVRNEGYIFVPPC